MPESSSAPVLFETLPTASGLVFGRATLNTPATLNALSLTMIDLLAPRLAEWAGDPQVAGVVLDATGDKAFCAGGDVVSLYRAIRATPAGLVPPEAAAFFEREYRLDYRIHTYPKPILCWGHGIVMGGGIGLLAGASHRVVTPRTRLAMPEIGIGLYPDVGGSWFLPRMPGRAGLFLALTGASLDAADACFTGLADVVLRHEDRAGVLAAIAAAEWHGDRATDAALLSDLLNRHGAAIGKPESPLSDRLARMDATIGHDGLADLAPRLLALTADPDPWFAQAARSFAGGSPTSAALSVEMQARAAGASLADVFRMEYQASVGCCLHHDFAEGVRALLVDKDKDPHWQPDKLHEVTPALIDAHLASHRPGPHPLADLGQAVA